MQLHLRKTKRKDFVKKARPIHVREDQSGRLRPETDLEGRQKHLQMIDARSCLLYNNVNHSQSHKMKTRVTSVEVMQSTTPLVPSLVPMISALLFAGLLTCVSSSSKSSTAKISVASWLGVGRSLAFLTQVASAAKVHTRTA